MKDYLYLFFKVGDKITAPGKEYLGLKDGMPICYIDPNEWPEGKPQNQDQKAYACCLVPIQYKQQIIDMCRPNQEPGHIDPKMYRARKKLITLSALQTATKIPDLETKLREHGYKVPTINGMQVNWDSLFKDSTTLNPWSMDNNQITAGTYRIGAPGGNYATWALGFADIANLTGNLTFTQISDVTETVSSTITENISTYTLTCTSNLSPMGDPTSGWIIDISAKNFHAFMLQHSGSGDVCFSDLYIKRTAVEDNPNYGLIVSASTSTGKLKIRDCLFDGNGKDGIALYISDLSITCEIYNCYIWDVANTDNGAFWSRNVNAGNLYENITIYNCAVGIDNENKTMSYKNIALFSNTTNFANNINSTSNNCGTNAAAVGAATDNNALVNRVAANEFQSVVDTNANFLRLRRTSTLISNGSAPAIAGNNHGIRGNPRPGFNGTDIGADEYDYGEGGYGRISKISNSVSVGIGR